MRKYTPPVSLIMPLLWALGFLIVFLSGCASEVAAPVTDLSVMQSTQVSSGRAETGSVAPNTELGKDFYRIKKGDTLYSIALENGQSYRDIATWNSLSDPNRILVDQVLRVKPLAEEASPVPVAGAVPPESAPVVRAIPRSGEGVSVTELKSTAPSPGVASPSISSAPLATVPAGIPKVLPIPIPAPVPAPSPPPPPVPAVDKPAMLEEGDLVWSWPLTGGEIITRFVEGGLNKGIDISAKEGQPVYAASSGRVVYSGQNLRGYGRLIMIKHNKQFLSVYAHNSQLLVEEGKNVVRGQKIAEAGNTDADTFKLHFEIRREGKPVDPLKLLPAR